MIDDALTRAWTSGEVRHAYTARDTILYALGLGYGQDPLDPLQLRHTYEQGLATLPSMAAVLASPGFWVRERRELGIDFAKLVHGEQGLVVHRPLQPEGTLVGRSRVLRIVDKGEGKGAVLHVEKQLVDAASGDPVATCEQVLFLRGDGGFSARGRSDEPPPAPAPTPDTPPDVVLDWATRPEAALVYRLSGDLNPLHVDPAVATRAGFPRPILHGLATWGIAAHRLVQACCGGDATRLRSFRARLSAPVYPGETLRVEVWRTGEHEAAFRCRVPARDMVVLSHGRAGWVD
jgi:acyl dehydratase